MQVHWAPVPLHLIMILLHLVMVLLHLVHLLLPWVQGQRLGHLLLWVSVCLLMRLKIMVLLLGVKAHQLEIAVLLLVKKVQLQGQMVLRLVLMELRLY